MSRLLVSSPVGLLQLTQEHDAIVGLSLAQVSQPEAPTALLQQAARQLEEYFEGARRSFSLPLRPAGTAFELAVWQALADIPYGTTLSYQQLAAHIGKPTAARAVGRAVGRNPIWIILPCHRVIGASGRLTGYAGGLEMKRALLTLEGAI